MTKSENERLETIADRASQFIVKETAFTEELAQLLNRHGAENASDTPDYQLARYLVACLKAWNAGVQARDAWYEIYPEPGWDGPKPGPPKWRPPL